MRNLFIILLFIQAVLGSETFIQKNEIGKSVTLVKNDFKILEFQKRIGDIMVSNSATLEVSFVKNKNKPLQTIKLFGKELGYSKVLITFDDKTTQVHEVNIVKNLSKIIDVIKVINKNIDIYQANGKVILKGLAKDTKEKEKIVDLLKQAGINVNSDIVNLIEVEKPNKMIRIKLYVTEIDNSKGLDIKRNWAIGYKNYARGYESGKEAPFPLENAFIPSLANAMDSAVSLTGGLAAGANLLGNNFNTGLTINFLSSKGVATVLDETELITLEGKKSVFHAGGKIYIKMQTTTATGLPSTQLKSIDYGLKLEVQVNDIVNGEFVDMTITTKQDKIMWNEQVDGIPGFANQSIDTFAIVKNKATVILGGLVNKNDAKNYWKIPLLGDIPILGELFRSRSFQSGNSELVFFIVPEIVDPSNNMEQEKLDSLRAKRDELSKKK